MKTKFSLNFDLIEWSVSMPPLTKTQAPAWIAFLMSTRGSLNVFQIGDPLGKTPRGSVSGAPLVGDRSRYQSA